MRGCLTAWLQQEGAAKCIAQLENQVDAKKALSQLITNQTKYKPEVPEPNDEPVALDEEEEKSNAEYAKMDLTL